MSVNRRQLLNRVILLAFLCQVALSWPLWLPGWGRTFPLLPAISIPLPASSTWHILQFTLLIGTALFLFLKTEKQLPKLAFLTILGILIIQDLSRLQPWVYLYALWLLADPGIQTDKQNRTLIWQGLLTAVYAWSGIHKLSPYFAEDNFPWFCEAFSVTTPLGAYPELGYGVALVELLFAPGLIWSKTRPVFRWLVPTFHVFIILALSPMGLDWNIVVIPWNLAMAILVFLLFDKQQPDWNWSKVRRVGLQPVIVLLLAWVMPLFNFVGLWDDGLSWKLYSNTQTEASFSSPEVPCKSLERVWSRYAYDQKTKLLLSDWAFTDLRVPYYSNSRTQRQLARYLCGCLTPGENAELILLRVHPWDKSKEQWESIPCSVVRQKQVD